ncbi:MAG: hypothetical protein H7331_08605 [Bacteroidia bacterium]|nr:hypothetical protein [Bacteroidia bacterium]
MDADEGPIQFFKLNSFIDKKYGKESITKLFSNSKLSDEQKINKIDIWWKGFVENNNIIKDKQDIEKKKQDQSYQIQFQNTK